MAIQQATPSAPPMPLRAEPVSGLVRDHRQREQDLHRDQWLDQRQRAERERDTPERQSSD
jgi:hypothetical protein